MTKDAKLLTPRDWQMQAQVEAAKLVGTDAYADKMVEARRYGAMADALQALQNESTKYRNEYSTSHAALQLVKAEREAAQAENAKLIAALAACRDVFPAPDPDSELDGWHVGAIADPLAVPEYVRACAEVLKDSHDFYRRRVDLLQQWQSKMRDPERTIACDIIANGQTLPPEFAGDRYSIPAGTSPACASNSAKSDSQSSLTVTDDTQSASPVDPVMQRGISALQDVVGGYTWNSRGKKRTEEPDAIITKGDV
jgi:hypothetical protein